MVVDILIHGEPLGGDVSNYIKKVFINPQLLHISGSKLSFKVKFLYSKCRLYTALRAVKRDLINRYPNLEIEVMSRVEYNSKHDNYRIYMSKDRLDYIDI